MAYDILIVNGSVVSATETRPAEVGIIGDKIAEVGPVLPRSGAGRVLEADGNLIIPGGVDVHTHLDMPLEDICTADDFETGTRAAAFGGTTTIVDFATQSPGQSLRRALAIWNRKALAKAVIDYGFHCVIVDPSEAALQEMDELACEGVTSFKVFMAYPGRLMLDDSAILEVLRRSSRNGSLVCIHCENGPAIEQLIRQALVAGRSAPSYHASTRPTAAEAEATKRAIGLAEKAGAPLYIVHVSCAEALESIAAARARGLPVWAETCPHYLFLSIDELGLPGFEGAKYVLTPPLRKKWNQDKLWAGLRDESLQAVSTDHCSFNYHGQKERGRDDFSRIPNGGPGIEHRLSLLFSGGVAAGRFNENRFVDLVSTTPAKLFGLYPRKGVIAAGSDADVVIFNPRRQHTISVQSHHMNVDYSMYEGLQVTGTLETVIARGRVIVEAGRFLGRPGRGEFLPRRGPALV